MSRAGKIGGRAVSNIDLCSLSFPAAAGKKIAEPLAICEGGLCSQIGIFPYETLEARYLNVICLLDHF